MCRNMNTHLFLECELNSQQPGMLVVEIWQLMKNFCVNVNLLFSIFFT